MITIEKLKKLKESEDKVEFKKGEGGNVSYNGGNKVTPGDRRRCILGYVTALCNEGGGYLVIGMTDNYPHVVVGTNQNLGTIGELESNIYRATEIRPIVYELYDGEIKKENRVLVIEVPSRPAGKVFKFALVNCCSFLDSNFFFKLNTSFSNSLILVSYSSFDCIVISTTLVEGLK